MSTLAILAIIAAVIGLVGSIVPGIPGPPVSWIGLLLVYFDKCPGNDGNPMTAKFLFIWLAITVIVTILDYVVPAWFTRVTGGHKSAAVGAIIGLIVGLLLPPIGMIVGSLAGAFLAELIKEDQGVWTAFKASLGAFLGFILTTGMKFICSGLMAYYIATFIF